MVDVPKLGLGGPSPYEIIDPDNCPILFGEVITELRVIDGAVYVSFGNVIQDGDEPMVTKVRVAARLRISSRAVQTITAALSGPGDSTPTDGQTIN